MTTLCKLRLSHLMVLVMSPLLRAEEDTPSLLAAAGSGDVAMVQQLLSRGEDVNRPGFADYTALMEAAYHGRVECLRALLAAGADANRTDAFDCSALSYAARRGHADCVRLLLAVPGIEVNKGDRDGETPLFKACRNGHTECARLLLEIPGIDINSRNREGLSPFAAASFCADTLALFRAFSDKLCITADDWEMFSLYCHGDTAISIVLLSILNPADIPLAQLGWMLYGEHPEPILKALLAHSSFCLNERDADGQTLLHYAVKDGNAKAVKLLLDAGADVSCLDGFHCYDPECHHLIQQARTAREQEILLSRLTPLHRAIMQQNPSALHDLLQAGADANMTDADGRTALHFALDFVNGSNQDCRQNYIRCVTILLSAPGVDVNRKNGMGDTALHLAVEAKSAECVQAVLSVPDVNLNDKNSDGDTALHIAAEQADGQCLQLLLPLSWLKVNERDSLGETPLLRAARKGNAACVQLLLSAPGIDINLPDENGRTPLTAAAAPGHHECVRLLAQDARADILARNAQGMTALHYACCNKNGAHWLPWLLNRPLEPALLNALLETAVCSQSSEATQILMQQKGIDTDLVTHLIHKAVELNDAEVLRLLLRAPGIQLRLPDIHTALQSAAEHQYAECVKVLLEVSDEE